MAEDGESDCDGGPSLLFVYPGAIGDLLLALPALRAFRAKCGARHVHAMLGDAAARLAGALALFDRVHRFGDARWTRLLASAAPGADVARWLDGFDAVLCFLAPGPARDAFAAACGRRVTAVDPRPEPGSVTHVSDQLAARLGTGPGDNAAPPIAVSPERCRHVNKHSGTGPATTLVLHPGSGSPRKCWPAARFARVAAAAEAHFHWKPVLLCGPADAEACQAVARHAAGIPGRDRNLRIVSPEFPEVRDLLAGARAFVGNDSGISHLAAALGTPTVAVFGPTDARVWGPRGPRVAVLQGRTLEDVTPAAVLAALRRLTGSEPAGQNGAFPGRKKVDTNAV